MLLWGKYCGNIARQVTTRLLLGTMVLGILYNLFFWGRTNSIGAFRIERNPEETLAEKIKRTPGLFEEIDLLTWLRLHATGSTLYAPVSTIWKGNLAAHHLAGVAGIRLKRSDELLPETLSKARVEVGDTRAWPAFTATAGIDIRIDPQASRPQVDLCAWPLTETTIVITLLDNSPCQGLPQ